MLLEPRLEPRSARSAMWTPPKLLPLVDTCLVPYPHSRLNEQDGAVVPGPIRDCKRRRASHHSGHRVAGFDDASTHIHPGEQVAADDEERDEADDRPAVAEGQLVDETEDERPQPARAAL